MFPRGVSKLAFLRAYEHRSIAVSLPFVLHGLALGNDAAIKCAVAYLQFRILLEASGYDSDSLQEMTEYAQALQASMHCLSALVNDGETDITCELKHDVLIPNL